MYRIYFDTKSQYPSFCDIRTERSSSFKICNNCCVVGGQKVIEYQHVPKGFDQYNLKNDLKSSCGWRRKDKYILRIQGNMFTHENYHHHHRHHHATIKYGHVAEGLGGLVKTEYNGSHWRKGLRETQL